MGRRESTKLFITRYSFRRTFLIPRILFSKAIFKKVLKNGTHYYAVTLADVTSYRYEKSLKFKGLKKKKHYEIRDAKHKQSAIYKPGIIVEKGFWNELRPRNLIEFVRDFCIKV